MKTITISKEQACRFLLAHQGLRPPYGYKGKAGILDFIRRVGCIQYDPLDIVGHNSELVLQSRINDFRPTMLNELLYEDRKLLDAWDKMIAIYRVEDWPYLRYRQKDASWRSRRGEPALIKKASGQILKAIEERGPLSSIDLDHDQKVDWVWGPKRLANVALDNMYYQGEVVIHHKVHTRKVYDLASRLIPAEIFVAPDPHTTQEAYHDWHFLRRIGGVGLLWDKHSIWHGIYRAGRDERTAALKRLVEQGRALEVKVGGIGLPLYMRSEDKGELDSIMEPGNPPRRAVILAPLDNLLWERELIKQLFNFDYTWEVYKPVPERRYGYYVLPILCGDQFVARFESGRDRENGALIIKNWWWEEDTEKSDEVFSSLKDCFQRFLGYLGADKIVVAKSLVKRESLDWLP